MRNAEGAKEAILTLTAPYIHSLSTSLQTDTDKNLTVPCGEGRLTLETVTL